MLVPKRTAIMASRDACRIFCALMRRSPPSFPLAALVCAASFLACSAQSPMYAPCTYTAADGSYFDLSPLTRFNAPEDYVLADAAGNSYVINVLRPSNRGAPPFLHRAQVVTPPPPPLQVCGDAMAVPTSCVDLEKIVPAPAYQVTRLPRHFASALLTRCRSLRGTTATGSAS